MTPGELPSTTAYRERQEARAAERSRESQRAAYEARTAAQQQRNADLKEWQRYRQQVENAAAAADGAMHAAIEAHDTEAAIQAALRARAIREAVVPGVNKAIGAKFSSGSFINVHAVQV